MNDRLLLSGAGLAGILMVLHACIDIKGTILDRFHYILFFLSVSMNPRYLRTVDADLKPVSVTVRVGQAVETVGQAGRPKTITGFQVTHSLSLFEYNGKNIEYANENQNMSFQILKSLSVF